MGTVAVALSIGGQPPRPCLWAGEIESNRLLCANQLSSLFVFALYTSKSREKKDSKSSSRSSRDRDTYCQCTGAVLAAPLVSSRPWCCRRRPNFYTVTIMSSLGVQPVAVENNLSRRMPQIGRAHV